MNNKATQFLLDRIREPSTWRGLVWVMTAIGITLSPDQIDAIVAVGMACAGLIGAFSAESKSSGHHPD